jgi:hypothetical protein
MRNVLVMFLVLLLSAPALAAESKEATEQQPKTLSGMSVLGNNEAPKSLVIVPWKSSQIGDGIGVVESLSNRPVPIDREVFRRELDYYNIRSSAPDAAGEAVSDVRISKR